MTRDYRIFNSIYNDLVTKLMFDFERIEFAGL